MPQSDNNNNFPALQVMTDNSQEHSILGGHGDSNPHLQWILGSGRLGFSKKKNQYRLPL